MSLSLIGWMDLGGDDAMIPGAYRTSHGSTVHVDGGVFDISFDWVEEGACCESTPSVYDGRLCWQCACCEGGSAELIMVPVEGEL